jgi:hypothetical protein
MFDENRKEEKSSDAQLEDEIILEDIAIKEEDIRQFPSEMVNDSPGTITDEIYQSLYQKVLKLNTQQKIHVALLLANQPTRKMLIQSPNKMISLAVLKNPKLTENEILSYAQQKNLVEDVFLAIGKDPRWMRNYKIKLAIVSNPKTPLSMAINFLSHLHDNDLKSLSRDKNISSILSRAAHQGLLKRKNGTAR